MTTFKDGIGRKFFFCLLMQLLHTLLLAVAILPVANYVTLTVFIMAGYVGGNIGSKVVKQMKPKAVK